MLKRSPLLIAIVTLAIAGCGDGGGGEASSPLDEALRYLPADTPFAVAIDTDTKGEQYQAIGEIEERFGEGVLVDQLQNALNADDSDLERIEKVLGNEFVVGSTDVQAFKESFVGAIQATDRAALDRLIKDEQAKGAGESNGATIYKGDGGDEFAVKDDVLIVAGTRKELDAALATRESDDSFTEEDFDEGTEGVPSDALVRVYVNAERLLAASRDSKAKQALESKWVDALTTGGIALTAEDDQLIIDFKVKTDGEDLADDELPIASGDESPEVLANHGGIGIALRDPDQILAFVQNTLQQVDPNTFSAYNTGRAQLERRLGIDLEEDLLDQMDAGLSVRIGIDGKVGARAELKDPKAFEKTLAKLSQGLPEIAEGFAGEKIGFAKPKAGEDFYAIATADGDQIVFGVVDGVFVLSDDARIAGTLAAEKTAAVEGAEGALVLRADAQRFGRAVITQLNGGSLFDGVKGALASSPLDELTGSVESSPEALSGKFRLTLD